MVCKTCDVGSLTPRELSGEPVRTVPMIRWRSSANFCRCCDSRASQSWTMPRTSVTLGVSKTARGEGVSQIGLLITGQLIRKHRSSGRERNGRVVVGRGIELSSTEGDGKNTSCSAFTRLLTVDHRHKQTRKASRFQDHENFLDQYAMRGV